MKIAVLVWGSLIWDKRELNIKHDWKKDGPYLPIEFARISNDGRLTLVLCKKAEPVQVLWNVMIYEDLEKAQDNLRQREGTSNINNVGLIDLENDKYNSKHSEVNQIVSDWANRKGLDAVIWTDLGVKFKNKLGQKLNLENVKAYLDGLPKNQKKKQKIIFSMLRHK